MQQAKPGDKVRVHYTGSLEDGEVFDSSDGRDPISFTIGSGNLIPGFEEAIVGMSPGDTKREQISPARGYGERREDLVFSLDRVQVRDVDIKVGDVLRVTLPNGRTTPVVVSAVENAIVTLDANHPLAGKTLTFDLTLVSIEDDSAGAAISGESSESGER